LVKISDLLDRQTGLYFPKGRWEDLERGLLKIAAEGKFENIDTLIQSYLSAPLKSSQIEVLANHLTVAETYFFRDETSFQALEEYILPKVISKQNHSRSLRVWCAGCSTGEEAYSIAISLNRVMPNRNDWDISILATDIAPQSLEKAKSGLYGEWSFRQAPAWLKDKYFKKSKPGAYQIDPRIQKMVTFQQKNIVDAMSFDDSAQGYDIIFCRNVLIYFGPDKIRNVVDGFYRCLNEGGFFFVGASEASLQVYSKFTAMSVSDVTFYQKPSSADSRSSAPKIGKDIAKTANQYDEAFYQYQLQNYEKAERLALITFESCREERVAALLSRIYANLGRTSEAIQWCEKTIAMNKLNPAHCYLYANVLQEAGRDDDAIEALKKTLRLDESFILAHFNLGHLMHVKGQFEKSMQCLDEAMLLLKVLPAESIVPHSEGLTAAKLQQMIQNMVKKARPA